MKRNSGVLGEAKVLAYLIDQGYEVFTQFSGKAPFDFVAYKDDKLYKVSVKSTMYKSRTGNWVAHLRHVSTRRKDVVYKHFDNTSVDFLAIYIIPEDRVILIDAKTVRVRTALNIAALAK